MSQVGTVRKVVCAEDQCVSARKVVEVSVLVCLRSSCYHVTGRRGVKLVRLALKAFMQNDGDFVDVILLHLRVPHNQITNLVKGIPS
jgi:hypothetical protein